jgi:hypothetical protein
MLSAGAAAERRLVPTELGRLTARLMVPPVESDNLRQALHRAAVPDSVGQAEVVLAGSWRRRCRSWRRRESATMGRLLSACEQMATQAHAAQAVPQLRQAARARGHASPDWPVTARPAQCRLDDAGYLAG